MDPSPLPTSEVHKPDEPYRGRRLDCVVINTTLDQEAHQLLQQFCPPGRKATGKFLSRLIYEHAARLTERGRVQQILQTAREEDHTTVG